MAPETSPFSRPFLKWAGGKYRLLGRILAELPAGERLVEPFAGSAALFLNAPFGRALICDCNEDLIALFRCLQAGGEEFIAFCRDFFQAGNNTPEAFAALRRRFNASREPIERSALLLYLNRHGYNGLVRYNGKGLFNVPFGRYIRPYFPEKELRVFWRRTAASETEFVRRDFRRVFAELRPGDVVYCDPPYAPLGGKAGFTTYAGTGFGPTDQQDLARLAGEAHELGIPVLISNHDTEDTRLLYRTARLTRFNAPRNISCSGKTRRPAPELLAVYA